MSNFNEQHPELQEDEIFLINIPEEEPKWKPPDFLESIREGTQAYMCDGTPVPDHKPLFGKRSS